MTEQHSQIDSQRVSVSEGVNTRTTAGAGGVETTASDLERNRATGYVGAAGQAIGRRL